MLEHATPPPTSAELFDVGQWRVDAAANELTRGSEIVRVEPKVMQVLQRLAGRAGGVVSREELLDAVWPGVVVGDEALTQTIIKLRRALGDNPRAPTHVETIAKRGYRLIAPVRALELPAPAHGAAATSEPAPPPRAGTPPLRRAWLAAVALALLLGTAGIVRFASSDDAVVPPAPAGSDGDVPTVTVVAFESLDAADDQAYLARGIGNDLMTDLSRLAGLRVVRSSAADQHAGSARYVVTGSVQRDGGTLRINVHVTDTQSRRQLWSERFVRPFGDLFAVQDEISRGLVEALPGRLQEAAKQTAAQRYTRNLAAYDHFLRGQSHFLVRQASDNDAARESYRKAIELDPAFARAYAGLAMTYAMDPRLRSSGDAAPLLARALELAETARGIDPAIPEVHWAIGFVHTQQRRHDKALQSLRKAVSLNRSYADAYALMAGIHTYTGEPAKSIPLMRTALRLDPGGGYLYFMVLGRAYFCAGDAEQAVINLREAAARNPVDLETRVFLAAALAAANDAAGAEWEAQEIRALEPRFSLRDWLQTYPLTDGRQQARLLQLLGRVGL
jgi:DNA-binding winged helix-turn-helix (wHTH) protein/TolB-like protein/Tfp pilus assembly protein PilF